jgi:hypothetical protein
MRQRAALLAPLQPTNRPYPRPEMGQQSADQAHRDGVAERWPEPAGPQRIAGARALLGPYAARLRPGARSGLKTAQRHAAHTRSRLRTVPGMGAMLRLGLLDAIPDSQRFARVPDVVSDCRLGQWATEAAGQRYGTSGTKMGHADLPGAFSAAAGLFVRANLAGQTSLAR